MNCSRCGQRWPNRECYVCGESLHEKTMTANTITERGMEEFSTTLWALSNSAVDLSTDITTGDITTANAAKKFNTIIAGLRALLATCDEP